MKILPVAIAGLLFAFQGQARAETMHLDLSGSGISSSLAVKYGGATDSKYPDAHRVTGISGTFSNSALNITDAKVKSLVAVNYATPEPENLLAPHAFSRFAVATGLPDENHGTLSYDNLLWPGGSPQTASDYPFHGGVLDIYGLLFRITGGKVVNFWSNGVFPGGEFPDYGVAVVTPKRALDYVGGVTVTASQVPVPGSLWLLAGGLVGLVAVRRRLTSV